VSYAELHSKIAASSPEELPAILTAAGYVPVQVDLESHTKAPEDEIERTVWAALDTSYRLLREASAKATVQSFRDDAVRLGLKVPTDEEWLAAASADADEPVTYLTLAGDTREAKEHLFNSFAALAEETAEGFAEALEDVTGGRC
jgi:hypothetical protein